MDTDMFFKMVIYILCSISLIAFIFLLVKLIITLNKVDKLVNDLTEKSRKIDGAFSIIDKVTDAVSSVSDKAIGVIFNAVTGLTNKFKKKGRMTIMSKKKKGLGKLLAGMAIGAGLGVLFAPKSGKETRKELKEKMDDLINKAKNIDKKEVKENIEKKIDEIKAELKDLDKEKALKIAKTKAKQIKEKAEDLVEYAKEKGTPVLEKAADSVREKAIEVTKQVLNKLEKEDK